MPKFQKGQSGNLKGRPKGAVSKKRIKLALDLYEILEEKKFCPFRKLVELADNNLDLNIQFNAAKELAQYLVPKLRAVAHSADVDNPVSFSLDIENSSQEVESSKNVSN